MHIHQQDSYTKFLLDTEGNLVLQQLILLCKYN